MFRVMLLFVVCGLVFLPEAQTASHAAFGQWEGIPGEPPAVPEPTEEEIEAELARVARIWGPYSVKLDCFTDEEYAAIKRASAIGHLKARARSRLRGIDVWRPRRSHARNPFAV